METTLEHFPQELLIEILTRVPAKSLVRFTRVSKSWYALITSSNFISAHLARIRSQSSKSSAGLLLTRHYAQNEKEEHYILHPDNDGFILNSSEIELPLKCRYGYYRVVGSCNGLICLSDDLFPGTFRTNPIIIWNPSIKKWIELPLPSIEPHSRKFFLGFGCDLQGLDYKVVRSVLRAGELAHETEVYSLSSKSWRKVPIIPKCHLVLSYSHVLVNGVLHWLAYGKYSGNVILGFNMKDEILNEILLPDALAGQHAASLCPVVYEDCLAVMLYNEYKGYCSLWVMKEYGNVDSWEKLYRTELVEGMGRVIGFRKKGHLLATMSVDELFVNDPASGVLVSFDPQDGNEVKDLGIFGKVNSIYAEHFLESLVLLEANCRF